MAGNSTKYPKDKALIVSVHHSAYSGDSSKGSSKNVAKVLDQAFDDADGRP
jgi:hypothetical protein